MSELVDLLSMLQGFDAQASAQASEARVAAAIQDHANCINAHAESINAQAATIQQQGREIDALQQCAMNDAQAHLVGVGGLGGLGFLLAAFVWLLERRIKRLELSIRKPAAARAG